MTGRTTLSYIRRFLGRYWIVPKSIRKNSGNSGPPYKIRGGVDRNRAPRWQCGSSELIEVSWERCSWLSSSLFLIFSSVDTCTNRVARSCNQSHDTGENHLMIPSSGGLIAAATLAVPPRECSDEASSLCLLCPSTPELAGSFVLSQVAGRRAVP